MCLVQISSRTHTPAAQDPKGGHIYRPSQGTFSFGAVSPGQPRPVLRRFSSASKSNGVCRDWRARAAAHSRKSAAGVALLGFLEPGDFIAMILNGASNISKRSYIRAYRSFLCSCSLASISSVGPLLCSCSSSRSCYIASLVIALPSPSVCFISARRARWSPSRRGK